MHLSNFEFLFILVYGHVDNINDPKIASERQLVACIFPHDIQTCDVLIEVLHHNASQKLVRAVFKRDFVNINLIKKSDP